MKIESIDKNKDGTFKYVVECTEDENLLFSELGLVSIVKIGLVAIESAISKSKSVMSETLQ